MKHFVGKPKQSGSTIQDAITQVDEKADAIEEKINALNSDLRKFREQMSKMREGSDKNAVKAKVMRVLKQKKFYEHQLDSLRGQSFNMEQTVFAQGLAKSTRMTVQAIKDGSRQLKREYQNINVDDIEDAQDDLAEMMAEVDEIQGALGQSYHLSDLDDDEINAELDALGEEIAVDNDTTYLDDVMMKVPESSKPKIHREREKAP